MPHGSALAPITLPRPCTRQPLRVETVSTLTKLQDYVLKGFSYAMIGVFAFGLATTAVGSYNVLTQQ